jgi:hypothetical protein
MSFLAGQILTAGQLNHILAGVMRRFVPETVQTFASSGTSSKMLNWTQADGDDGDESGMLFANDEVEITENGLYMLTVSVGWATNSDGDRGVGVQVNGSIEAFVRWPVSSPLTLPGQSAGVTTMRLEPGDIIQGRALQTSGGNLNTSIGSNRTRFEVVKLRGVP